MSSPAKQDPLSKEPDPVALPKTVSGLTWLTGKQKTELTSLIQDSIQSAIRQVVSETTSRVLVVARPSPQPSRQASSRNDFRNIQQDEDPDKIESSTDTDKDDQHVDDMLMGDEEPQLVRLSCRKPQSGAPVLLAADRNLGPQLISRLPQFEEWASFSTPASFSTKILAILQSDATCVYLCERIMKFRRNCSIHLRKIGKRPQRTI